MISKKIKGVIYVDEMLEEVEGICKRIIKIGNKEPTRLIEPLFELSKLKQKYPERFRKIPNIASNKFKAAAKIVAAFVLNDAKQINDKITKGEITEEYGKKLIEAREKFKEKKRHAAEEFRNKPS